MKKIIISTLLLTITLAETEQGLRCYDIYPAEGTNTFTEYDDDGQKALYPTFVNLGMQNLLTEDAELMKIMFKARKSMKWNAEVTDRMLVDRYMKYITH